MKYTAADCSGCEIEIEADSAEEAAQEYVDSGDWGTSNSTTWIDVRVTEIIADAGQLIDELISLGVVWSGEKETAARKLSSGESWGCGIKDDPSFWAEAEAIADCHGFTAEVDDSDGSPYLSISGAPEGNTTHHKIKIDPEEPKCIGKGEHDWQSPFSIVGGIKENPGVWGHGGGVTIDECCLRCGCMRLTDTWAQDMKDGTQGLRSVEYTEGQYKDDLEARAKRWAKRQDDTYEIDKEELELAFIQIYGREPESDEDQWSLVCGAAGIEEEQEAE